jgi:hypothetical protein
MLLNLKMIFCASDLTKFKLFILQLNHAIQYALNEIVVMRTKLTLYYTLYLTLEDILHQLRFGNISQSLCSGIDHMAIDVSGVARHCFLSQKYTVPKDMKSFLQCQEK